MGSKLYFKFGCMNSAKSMLLLTTAHNLEENGLEIMVLKPSADTRDGEGVIRSRVGLERKCINVDSDVNLYKAIKEYRNFLSSQLVELKWVLVDECQFLTEMQIDQLSDVVDFLNINVMCYGLRTDFQSKLFPASKRLFELADDLEEIKSTCSCGDNKTSINARFDADGNIITEGDQVVIGGNDMYKPLCRKCWKNKIRDKKIEE
jgi:thymidine kinase